MYQGETLITTMKGFPCDVQNISALLIMFKQNGQVILTKTLSNCLIDTIAQEIKTQLTQEESLRFSPGTVERSVIFKIGSERYEVKPDSFIVQATSYNQVF